VLKRQPNSRLCFICGLQNPVGLKMSIYNDLDNRQVVSTVTVPDHFQGYPGVVHGGIVATILDEVAGRATLISGNDADLMVTVKIEVKYRQPTPTLTPLTVTGRVTQPGRTRARAQGEIRLPDGSLTAEAELLLAQPTADFRDQWAEEMPYWKVYPDA
jgi:uncharacterized protein (TIGR00369 family)